MTSLLDLLDKPPALPAASRDLPIDEQFAAWVEHNPELIDFVTRRALAAARNGAKRLSAKAIIEEVRMSSLVTVNGRRDWKANNTFTAPLARLLMERHPELVGLFETRRRRTEA